MYPLFSEHVGLNLITVIYYWCYCALGRYARWTPPWGPKRHAIEQLLLDNQQACHPPIPVWNVGLQRSAHVISDHTWAGELIFGRWCCTSVMPAINDNAVSSKPEGSGTFWMVTWNIVNGRGGRLTQAAAGMVQIGIGLAVLVETKIVDDRHPKATSGYTIMCS